MKLDTLGVQALVAVDEQGGFGRAAETLHITQAALSRRIQNLESFLGVKLVERTTRSVALTRSGATSCRRRAGCWATCRPRSWTSARPARRCAAT